MKKAIESIITQTLNFIELIVVDDNNPNSEARTLTENIINDLKDTKIKIIYIKHSYNKNGASARNTGISVATGKYISFLDSDDEYHPDRLKRCYEKMEDSSYRTAGVYTGCEFRKKGRRYYIFNKAKSGNFLKESLACNFMICTGSNLFIRKKVLVELDGFDIQFTRHQDYEFLVRLFRKYNLESIQDVLVIKNNENLNLPSVDIMIKVKRYFLKKFQSFINDLNIEDQKYIYCTNYVQIAEQALKSKDYKKAKKYYLKANNYSSIPLRSRFRKIAFTISNLIYD